MIPFDFIYLRPDTLQEAVNLYTQLETEGKSPFYYAGGSEIISMCRAGSIQPGAVIDIKNIPECMILSVDDQKLHIGSVCTLNQISESNLFPLLKLSGGRIADHTNQCRITIGGNLCGTIIYRETSLPLLLSDAEITVFGKCGEQTFELKSIFDGRMLLKPGEIIVQIHVPVWALSANYAHIKQTANEKIDYPLVSIAAMRKENYLRIAFSGICSFPFRSAQIEKTLNDRTRPCCERAEMAATQLPESAYSDAESSGEYRLFVLKNMLEELLEDWENGKI